MTEFSVLANEFGQNNVNESTYMFGAICDVLHVAATWPKSMASMG